MSTNQSINAASGLVFELQRDVIKKGGGIHGDDFKIYGRR